MILVDLQSEKLGAPQEKELDEVAQGGPLVVPDAHVVPAANDGKELRELRMENEFLKRVIMPAGADTLAA